LYLQESIKENYTRSF